MKVFTVRGVEELKHRKLDGRFVENGWMEDDREMRYYCK